MRVYSLGQEDPPEVGMETHSSVLAWRTPWTEEPGGSQCIGLQRVKPDWATNTHTHTNTQKQPRKWQKCISRNGKTFLALNVSPLLQYEHLNNYPKSYSNYITDPFSWTLYDLTTQRLETLVFADSFPSSDSLNMRLSKHWELVMGRAAWRAAVHGVAKSRTRLCDWTDYFSNFFPFRLLQSIE